MKILFRKELSLCPICRIETKSNRSRLLPAYDELDKIIELFIDEGQSADEIISMGFKAQTVKKIVKLILRVSLKEGKVPLGQKITKRHLEEKGVFQLLITF